MNLNWFAAEMLMKQGQMKIERSAREAWKWSDNAMKKQSGRFFSRRQIIRVTPTACCAKSCC
ncbi:hypothetical protein M5X11_22385 [Paenibacillus alginolyticus]|uniref:hypothetical protein n=1 Tax=Paenibacillus alginolyticus TaxID=59839 RepID=UPI0003F4D4BB|nr:hypothetical protein [Paenibacillus alginolyticus]MCY9667632.1 hypothetical protein [Paenibacillus alginolyticus]